jgi:hypothetical protein
VEHERRPLGRPPRPEHDQQRQADRVSQQSALFGVDVVAGDDRVEDVHAQRLLRVGPARTQPVEADPTDDGRQPAAHVLDGASVGSAEPEPGLLDRTIHLREHPDPSDPLDAPPEPPRDLGIADTSVDPT